VKILKTFVHIIYLKILQNQAPLVAVIGFPMNSIIALLLFYNSGVHVGNMANSNSILSDPNIDDLLPKNAGKKLNLPEYFPERNFFYTNQWQLGMVIKAKK
jgi:hypothetical protein